MPRDRETEIAKEMNRNLQNHRNQRERERERESRRECVCVYVIARLIRVSCTRGSVNITVVSVL